MFSFPHCGHVVGLLFRLVQRLGSPQFQPIISPPLCLEYEDVLCRSGMLPGYTEQEIDDFLDFVLSECMECQIHFLWRPYLPDPKDDMILELALAGGAGFIITHNLRDFRGVESLGVRAVTPDSFLSILSMS